MITNKLQGNFQNCSAHTPSKKTKIQNLQNLQITKHGKHNKNKTPWWTPLTSKKHTKPLTITNRPTIITSTEHQNKTCRLHHKHFKTWPLLQSASRQQPAQIWFQAHGATWTAKAVTTTDLAPGCKLQLQASSTARLFHKSVLHQAAAVTSQILQPLHKP